MAPAPPAGLVLRGPRLLVRAGRPADAPLLHAIRSEPEVVRWWRAPDPVEVIAAELAGDGDGDEVVLVVEVDGAVVGAIQYYEETEPDYRHAAIDIYLSGRHQRQGLGPEAVRVLATYLVDTLGHHRLTIDPAADNSAAIRAYERVGFRPVGVLRRYERGVDGSWHDGLLMDLLAEELIAQPGEAGR
jgi:aminoglycoside 6'-N-acetyltransferase